MQGLGRLNRNPPSFSIHGLSPPIPNSDISRVVSIFLYLRGSFHEFSWQQFFSQGWVVSPPPNPQPEGPGCLSLSGSSPLTFPAWEAVPVATLPPAEISGSFDHSSPPTTSKWRHLQKGVVILHIKYTRTMKVYYSQQHADHLNQIKKLISYLMAKKCVSIPYINCHCYLRKYCSSFLE
jgi:hypothetical protein